MKAAGTQNRDRGSDEHEKFDGLAMVMETFKDDEEENNYKLLSKVIETYKDDDSSLIMILHAAQGIFGYLPAEVQNFIARKMNIPSSRVSGVVTFYSFFSTKERGEHTVRVCLGTACYVRGGKQLIAELEEKLGAKVGDTSPDKKFTFEIVRCIGACGLAPAIMIDDDVYKQVTPRKLDAILAKYRN